MPANIKAPEDARLVRILQEKISELVSTHPQKAAIILTAWLNQASSRTYKKKVG